MSIVHNLQFHFIKWLRFAKYNIKYHINKWKEIDGIYLPVYLKYGYSVLRFIDDGTYECEEIKIVKEKLQNTDIVLELGTGMGFIASFCSKQIGQDKVYTFEANPQMVPVIKEVFQANGVHPQLQIALVGNNDTEGRFMPHTNFLASSQKQIWKEGQEIKVPVLNLNRIIQNVSPSYLIMDIEGNEFEVFSMIDFQTIHKVQFELHPSLLKQDEIEFIFQKLADNCFVKDALVSSERNFFFERKGNLL